MNPTKETELHSLQFSELRNDSGASTPPNRPSRSASNTSLGASSRGSEHRGPNVYAPGVKSEEKSSMDGGEPSRLEAKLEAGYPRVVGRYPRVKQDLPFVSNYVRTTKYTMITFLPFSLFSQFKRLANVYFLLVAILQSIPAISPLSPITAIAPLVFVVTLSMVRDGIEDYYRWQSDRAVNAKRTEVWDTSTKTLTHTEWQNLRVGDIVRINDREHIPADILLFTSTADDGVCYVDTMNLDGETNLKRRIPHPTTVRFHDFSEEELDTIHHHVMVRCEEPQGDLYSFNGVLYVGEDIQVPVDSKQLLHRGAQLRNTQWVMGMVVYAGFDSKEMLNSKQAVYKQSNIERVVNLLIISIFATQVLLSFVAAVLGGIWVRQDARDHDYVQCQKYQDCDAANTATLQFWTYMVLLNTLIPSSLIVTMEIVKVVQALFIRADEEMEYGVDEFGMPKGATVRSVTLNEELGQVEYLLSDKTGTLTENKMEFSMCSVAGRVYASNPKAVRAHHDEPAVEPMLNLSSLAERHRPGPEDVFLTMMTLCNTILVEHLAGQKRILNSDSPDEIALVNGADAVGYEFLDRNGAFVEVNLGGVLCTYEILQVIPFTSARKRMSIIARRIPREGVYEPGAAFDIVVFTKGADSVMLPLCSKHSLNAMPPGLAGIVAGTFKQLVPSERRSTSPSSATDRWSEGGGGSGGRGSPDVRGAWERYRSQRRKSRRGSGSSVASASSRGSGTHGDVRHTTNDHLTYFAQNGLRTLLFGFRTLDERTYAAWHERFQHAELLPPVDRMKEFEALSAEVENELVMVGASAIEDKLQQDVPETISRLLRANIKIWVLTGDKQETAIEIGRASSLIQQATSLHLLNATSAPQLNAQIGRALTQARGGHADHCVVIDGATLSFVVQADDNDHIVRQTATETFMQLVDRCKTVIVCRCSPMQKALIVELVRSFHPGSITMAVGDGANDVSMIRAASVGVGIAGQEGMQAVRSSDFAIQYFRDLDRLLLFHGRVAYVRLAQMITYFFYKNIAFTFPLWVFGAFCVWSGQTFYDDIYITLYNTIFTVLPVFAFAVMEQDLPQKRMLMFPELYRVSQSNWLFCYKMIMYWFGLGYSAAILFTILPIYTLPMQAKTPDGLWFVSIASFTCLVFGVTLKLMLLTKNWNWVTAACYVVSLGAYFGVVYAYDGFESKVEGVVPEVLASPTFWLVFLLCLTVVALVHFTIEGFYETLAVVWGSPVDLVRPLTDKQAEELSLQCAAAAAPAGSRAAAAAQAAGLTTADSGSKSSMSWTQDNPAAQGRKSDSPRDPTSIDIDMHGNPVEPPPEEAQSSLHPGALAQFLECCERFQTKTQQILANR